MKNKIAKHWIEVNDEYPNADYKFRSKEFGKRIGYLGRIYVTWQAVIKILFGEKND